MTTFLDQHLMIFRKFYNAVLNRFLILPYIVNLHIHWVHLGDFRSTISIGKWVWSRCCFFLVHHSSWRHIRLPLECSIWLPYSTDSLLVLVMSAFTFGYWKCFKMEAVHCCKHYILVLVLALLSHHWLPPTFCLVNRNVANRVPM